MTGGFHTCRVCGSTTEHPTYPVREMMFGTREVFLYFQCEQCGCLQIANIPKNLSSHYPSTYYSFATEPAPSRHGTIYRWLQKQRCRTALFARGFKLNSLLKRHIELPRALFADAAGAATGDVLRKCDIRNFSAHFLDVGCGSHSRWLEHLSQLGFRNLLGTDPFIAAEKTYGRVRILNRTIHDIEGQFDLITFHHSLEHVPEQLDTLIAARKRLKAGGTCLVRVPIVSSLVWERYGVNWVELDAPRHLYLHSVDSMCRLGRDAGFRDVDILFDSLPLEFFGSEQYARDIPLTDARSLWVNPDSTLFSLEEKASFRAMAAMVNAERRGGRAGFYFRA